MVARVNRRHCERLALQLPVDMCQNGRYLGRYWIRDISPAGAFIETAGAPPSLVDGTLELALGSGDVYHGDVSRHVQALVVRATPYGVGVWIGTPDVLCHSMLDFFAGLIGRCLDAGDLARRHRALH